MRALSVLVLAACGRFGFDATGGSGSGGVDAGSVVGRWSQVAVGANWTCAVALDTSLSCWGYLPDMNIVLPTQIAGSWSTIAVSSTWAGGDHACGLQLDGSLWCWGYNEYGQLGDGTTTDVAAPERIGTATWTQVSAGDQHTCGVQLDGSLWCWGYNFDGQLGDGTTTARSVPAQIAGTWLQVSAGSERTCAVRGDDSVWCWGDNSIGQFGDGTTTASSVPVQAQVTGAWSQVSVFTDATCAIAVDHRAACWGGNMHGQLAVDPSTTSGSPTPLTLAMPFVAIATGDEHTCAVDGAGGAWCWGDSSHGQLGIVAAASANFTPVRVADAGAVSAAGDVTCVIDAAHRLACTGANTRGQLATMPGETHVPTRADARTDWRTITAMSAHGCGAVADGTTHCWGSNGDGELGDGSWLDRQSPIAGGGAGFTSITAGPNNTIGISGGTAMLWGCDWAGGSNNPTAEMLSSSGWIAAASGDEHTCGVVGTQLRCRGDNTHGQLGDGTTTSTTGTTDTVVAGAWIAVAANAGTTCAIDTSRHGACWGENTSGQVGNNTSTDATAPQQLFVPGAPLVASSLVVGPAFACSIDSTGALWCWGDNSCGQLGNGTSGTTTLAPAQVGTATTWAELAVGDRHVCGVWTDHTLWCWGNDDEGELGDPSLASALVPTQVGSDATWLHVAAGTGFTCAIKMDGTRWCMGSDDAGQLGNGLAWRFGFAQIP